MRAEMAQNVRWGGGTGEPGRASERCDGIWSMRGCLREGWIGCVSRAPRVHGSFRSERAQLCVAGWEARDPRLEPGAGRLRSSFHYRVWGDVRTTRENMITTFTRHMCNVLRCRPCGHVATLLSALVSLSDIALHRLSSQLIEIACRPHPEASSGFLPIRQAALSSAAAAHSCVPGTMAGMLML